MGLRATSADWAGAARALVKGVVTFHLRRIHFDDDGRPNGLGVSRWSPLDLVAKTGAGELA